MALLFVADLYFFGSELSLWREGRIDKSIIRIKSMHKWPEKVVYDTSLPTIVPHPQLADIEDEKDKLSSPAPAARDSFAKMASAQPERERTSRPKRKVARRSVRVHLASRPPSQAWCSDNGRAPEAPTNIAWHSFVHFRPMSCTRIC